MTDSRQPALRYYDQAQRIRQMAADAHSEETRTQFLTLAEQYERLAGQALKTAPRDNDNRPSMEQAGD